MSFPPPIKATFVIVLCGCLNGILMFLYVSIIPLIEYIFATSIFSSSLRGGNIDVKALASIVLPDPGLPYNIMLCLPAAATSRALFDEYCPIMESKLDSNSISSSLLLFLNSKGNKS